MDIPSKLKGPVLFKESKESRTHLNQLTEFLKSAPESVKKQVEKDIKIMSYGISGEENVLFELMNSYMPILILHDLHLEYEGLSAQIDYLVITPKINLVIECKNLIGDIEVTNNGEFIRYLDFGGKKIREGIYSPITQNQRHLDLIKSIRLELRNNFLTRALFEKTFNDVYKSVVVLANPKTVVNLKYANKVLKNQIIRADQLVGYLKNIMNENSASTSSPKEMYELADFFLKSHTPNIKNYIGKYLVELPPEDLAPVTQASETEQIPVSTEETPIYQALRDYRYKKSKEEGVKPYYIYNNAQMNDLISLMPKTVSELITVSGFGSVKCEKYGADILKIVDQHR